MKTSRYILLLLLIVAVFQGCAFSRGTLGDTITPEAVAAIHQGSTTRSELLQLLGAPDRLFQLNGRDVLHYYRYDAKAGSLLLIILNFTRLSVKSDDLFVVLNNEGVVEDIISSTRTNGLKFRFWPFGE
jgi:outer membrane protein assembly factor BamE (lipoprotein component of BamABCDE complex)